MIIDEEFTYWNQKLIEAFGEGIPVSAIPYDVYSEEIYELVRKSLTTGENLLEQKFRQ